MAWKQPIPTDLESEFGEDTECYILMVLLIIKASNSEGVMNSGKTVHTIKRGEVVFGRKAWAKYFGGSEFKAKRALERLQNLHNKVHIKITNKYTLVELINYDELVSLAQDNAQQTNNKLTTDAQQTHTSLYAKSVKSEKSEDIHISPEDLKRVAEVKRVPLKNVENSYQSLKDYCKATGKTYKDYTAALRNFVQGDIDKGKVKQEIKTEHITSPF